MNKVITIALIAGGLLLLDSPEAAAHQEVRNQHQSQAHYRHNTHRHNARGHNAHGRDYRFRDYGRHGYDRRAQYRYESKYKRARHVPRWLRHERSFLRWYEHTPLRSNRYIAWSVLFDIYRAEHRYQSRYQRRHRY